MIRIQNTMLVPIVAAAVTLAGVAGFVLSSLLHASGAADIIFNVAAVFMIGGPLIFFAYIIFGLYLDFISMSDTPEATSVVRPTVGAAAQIVNIPFTQSLPEGLKRERKGPLNRSTGRGNRI